MRYWSCWCPRQERSNAAACSRHIFRKTVLLFERQPKLWQTPVCETSYIMSASSQKQECTGLQALPDLVFQQNLLAKLAPLEKMSLMLVCKDLRQQVLRCNDPAPWASFGYLHRDHDCRKHVASHHKTAQQAAGRFALHVGGHSFIPRRTPAWDNTRNQLAIRIFTGTSFNALTTLHLQVSVISTQLDGQRLCSYQQFIMSFWINHRFWLAFWVPRCGPVSLDFRYWWNLTQKKIYQAKFACTVYSSFVHDNEKSLWRSRILHEASFACNWSRFPHSSPLLNELKPPTLPVK